MTGPEHYREAEKLLKDVANLGVDHPALPIALAEAQVHATMALAAATALAGDADGMHITDIRAWNAAVGGAS